MSGPDESAHAFFVYGTLMRGGCREKCWPKAPLSIEPALARGKLYDLGEYPALVEGTDWVRGELWQFTPADMSAVTHALDPVEGCLGRSDDLYHRRVIQCETAEGNYRAFAYFYADVARLKSAACIRPGPDGFARWRAG